MLYTITDINGNEVTLDKQPPSTVVGRFGLRIHGVYSDRPIVLISSEEINKHGKKVGDSIVLEDEPYALRYNEGKLRWSLVDWKSMEPMVQVLEFGSKKYEEDNWKKPMDKKQILNSAMRHLIAMMNGEENDPESGLPHVGHLMCNAMFYSYHSKSNDSK